MNTLLSASIGITLAGNFLLPCQWTLPISHPVSSSAMPRAKQEQPSNRAYNPLLSTNADRLCGVSQNHQDQGGTTFIGNIPGAPYVVIVPVEQPNTLVTVRQCIPDAFQTDSRLGPYVQAGVFPNRDRAESLALYLRNFHLDARVIYRR